jgi:hypothetical protein
MTTAVKEKKPFLPQRRTPAPVAGDNSVAVRGALPTRSASPVHLVVGGEPRVHLLPAEVSQRKKLRELKRKLLTYGVIALVLVFAAYGAATFVLTTAQGSLDSARTATAQLLTQQAKYGEVTKVNSDITAIKGAQVETTNQEILWEPFVAKLQATLPSDAILSSVTASIDAPSGATNDTGAAAPPAVPLQQTHIATVLIVTTMAQSEVPGWLDRLPLLTGYADAEVTSATQAGSNRFVVDVTLHLNSDAISGRFTKTGSTTK